MNVEVTLDEKKIIGKIDNDEMGLFVSNEWKRLIDPYTPRDTATMQNTAVLHPFAIEYIQPYSVYVYEGEYMNFQHINPFSTDHWDVKAANAGQLDKLYQSIKNKLGG